MGSTYTVRVIDLVGDPVAKRPSWSRAKKGAMIITALLSTITPFGLVLYSRQMWDLDEILVLVFCSFLFWYAILFLLYYTELFGLKGNMPLRFTWSDNISKKQLARAQRIDGALARLDGSLSYPHHEALAQTRRLMDAPLSEDQTPPEVRPENAVLLPAIVIGGILSTIIIAVASLWLFAYAIDESSKGVSRELISRGAIPLLLFLLVGAIGGTIRWVRRSKRKTAAHLLDYDARPPVIFLRSFKDDGFKIRLAQKDEKSFWNEPYSISVRFEEGLSYVLSRLGPFIALGQVREILPQFGAARAYSHDTVWKKKVEGWLAQAQCLVFLVGHGEGLSWESQHILAKGLEKKTIFLTPPVDPKSLAFDETWKGFTQMFGMFRAVGDSHNVDRSKITAMWMNEDGVISVVQGRRGYVQDYEWALRIAIFELGLLPA